MKYKLNEELDTVVEILGNTTSILDEIVRFDINQLKINEDLTDKLFAFTKRVMNILNRFKMWGKAYDEKLEKLRALV